MVVNIELGIFMGQGQVHSTPSSSPERTGHDIIKKCMHNLEMHE